MTNDIREKAEALIGIIEHIRFCKTQDSLNASLNPEFDLCKTEQFIALKVALRPSKKEIADYAKAALNAVGRVEE